MSDDDAPAAAAERDVLPSTNTYVPSVLPEWKAWSMEKKSKSSRRSMLDEDSTYANTASRLGWKGRVEHAIGHLEKYTNLDENLLACLLECVITSVIGLASNQTIPEEYLHCSFLYLQHIKNEFGENPPNIAAFLEHIKSNLAEEDLEALESMAELSSVGSGVIITRLPKSLQRSLCE